MTDSDIVVKYIHEMVENGRIEQGDRLPAERALSEKLGISRIHVRQALKKLEVYGVLDIRPQSGAYLANKSPHMLESMISDMLRIEHYSFKSLVHVRVLLEADSVRLCALNRTEEDLGNIRQALKAFEENEFTSDRVHRDLEFHKSIAHASHNNVLESLLMIIVPDILDAFNKYRVCRETDVNVVAEHRKLFKAIEERNPDKAEKCIMEHLRKITEFAETL